VVFTATSKLVSAQVFLFSLSAQRQAMRIRRLYFEAMMRHELAWFDTIDSGELTSRVAGYVQRFPFAS
jgi:ATP-binding cassette subfamily B (MDR/TAP) protein 1